MAIHLSGLMLVGVDTEPGGIDMGSGIVWARSRVGEGILKVREVVEVVRRRERYLQPVVYGVSGRLGQHNSPAYEMSIILCIGDGRKALERQHMSELAPASLTSARFYAATQNENEPRKSQQVSGQVDQKQEWPYSKPSSNGISGSKASRPSDWPPGLTFSTSGSPVLPPLDSAGMELKPSIFASSGAPRLAPAALVEQLGSLLLSAPEESDESSLCSFVSCAVPVAIEQRMRSVVVAHASQAVLKTLFAESVAPWSAIDAQRPGTCMNVVGSSVMCGGVVWSRAERLRG